ncbi:MAG: TetR/AcrR family transcriptional regulator [Pseudomonadota bacterium]
MPRTASYDRDDLIDRAQALFWRKGWSGTSMKDLEAELNLRPGSFYAAFGSKEALYALALDRYATRGTERLARLAKTHDPLDALKAHLRAVVSDPDAGARACMLAKTVLELGRADGGTAEALVKRASDHLARAEDAFAGLFAAARDAGRIASHHDPARLARRFQSDLLGLRVSAERPSVDAPALAEEIAGDLDALAK